jgi:hypothetical protein
MDSKNNTTIGPSQLPKDVQGGVEKDTFKFELTDFGTSYTTEAAPYLCICRGCNCLCWAAQQQ